MQRLAFEIEVPRYVVRRESRDGHHGGSPIDPPLHGREFAANLPAAPIPGTVVEEVEVMDREHDRDPFIERQVFRGLIGDVPDRERCPRQKGPHDRPYEATERLFPPCRRRDSLEAPAREMMLRAGRQKKDRPKLSRRQLEEFPSQMETESSEPCVDIAEFLEVDEDAREWRADRGSGCVGRRLHERGDVRRGKPPVSGSNRVWPSAAIVPCRVQTGPLARLAFLPYWKAVCPGKKAAKVIR